MILQTRLREPRRSILSGREIHAIRFTNRQRRGSLSLSLSFSGSHRRQDRFTPRSESGEPDRRHRRSPKGNRRRARERGGEREVVLPDGANHGPIGNGTSVPQRFASRGQDMQLGRCARGKRERERDTLVRNGNKFARQTSPSCHVVYLSIACLPRGRERKRLKWRLMIPPVADCFGSDDDDRVFHFKCYK